VKCSSANVEPTCQLTAEREALLDIPNVYSYQTFIDSDKAGYLIRQWVASSLYDRIR
jgi:phosphoinositide-3-kinase, regulatory subunit 4